MVSVEDVKEFCPEIHSEAVENEVDIESVVKELSEKYGDRYSQKTVLSKIRAELRRRNRDASAELDTVLIAGARDRYNFNMPASLLCLKKDGGHKEVRTFSFDHVPYGSEKIRVPVPSVAKLKMQYNQQYDNYTLVGIESYKEINGDKLRTMLKDLAVQSSELGEDDQYSIVIVKGRIRQVQAATEFDDEGNPIGSSPVMMEDGRKNPQLHPTLQIRLESDDGEIMPRLLLERPKRARPIYDIEDFDVLCRDALENEESDDQAREISESLEGRKIIAVGVLMKYNPATTRDESEVIYVDIGVGGVYEVEDIELEEKEPKQRDKPVQEQETKQEQEQEQGSAEETMDFSEESKQTKVDKAKTQIRAYLRARDESPANVTPEGIMEALNMKDMSPAIIKQVLEELSNESQ